MIELYYKIYNLIFTYLNFENHFILESKKSSVNWNIEVNTVIDFEISNNKLFSEILNFVILKHNPIMMATKLFHQCKKKDRQLEMEYRQL